MKAETLLRVLIGINAAVLVAGAVLLSILGRTLLEARRVLHDLQELASK